MSDPVDKDWWPLQWLQSAELAKILKLTGFAQPDIARIDMPGGTVLVVHYKGLREYSIATLDGNIMIDVPDDDLLLLRSTLITVYNEGLPNEYRSLVANSVL